MTKRLVIANRGEIARRILRGARERNYTVAVVSTPDDADALVRREADAVLEVSSFLSIEDIVAASKAWGAELLHPGYGFLSENPDFAQAVEAAGIGFVGPTAKNMRALGGKESAKAFAQACGVPTLEALLSDELANLSPARWGEALEERGIHAPFLVKASAGGGGRGMRIVEKVSELRSAIQRASSEAKASFGDGTVFVERCLREPRHIEIQVFGDGQGNGVFLGERECSLQRRHQKVLEEAPSSVVDEALRETMGQAAVMLVCATHYRGAGTVEFLLDEQRRFYFLEMNTRLQVEHPVTELAYGVDLVQAQFELAEGRWPDPLGDPMALTVPKPRGVALEARILAEDPRNGFLPTPGPLLVYREPAGEGVRVDSGVEQGGRVNAKFDSMIAKLIVWGEDRAQAVARLSKALEDFTILGCTTNLPFLQAVARHPDFLAGRESTAWIGEHLTALNQSLLPGPLAEFLASPPFAEALSDALKGPLDPVPDAAGRFAAQRGAELRVGSAHEKPHFRLERAQEPHRWTLRGVDIEGLSDRGASLDLWACRRNGTHLELSLQGDSLLIEDPAAALASPARALEGSATGQVKAPMAGKVVEVRVSEGASVEKGQILFLVESMKMQLEVLSPAKGRVASIVVEAGQILGGPDTLAILEMA